MKLEEILRAPQIGERDLTLGARVLDESHTRIWRKALPDGDVMVTTERLDERTSPPSWVLQSELVPGKA